MNKNTFKFTTKLGKEIELAVGENGFVVRDSDGVYIIDASILNDDGQIDIPKKSISKQFSLKSNEYRISLVENE